MKLLSLRKRKPDSSKLFVASLEQAVLAFLLEHDVKDYYSIELSDDAGLSRGGVNQALHVLEEAELVTGRDVGIERLYRANLAHPQVRAFKALLESASSASRR